MDFKEKYGPWAVVAGASEGVGRAFARQIAAQGVNLLLIARREAPLAELAAEISAESGVECVTAAIDLALPDSAERVIAAVEDREIGLYISNAGSDPYASRFLDSDVANWTDIANRNVLNILRCCHHFGTAMRARRRGGMVLVGSGACYGGASFMGTYAGTKAFALNFAEGLWAELKPYGVDVLFMALNMTDTPELRRLLGEKGLPLPDGISLPEDVAAQGLDRLPHGPVLNIGLADDQPGYGYASAASRRERIAVLDAGGKRIFGE